MRVGIEHLLTGEQGCRGEEAAVAADRVFYLQAVAPADDIVVQAMSRGRMHGAGACVERDVICEDYGHLAIVERMPQFKMLELRALDRGHGGPRCHPQRVQHWFDEFSGQQQPLATCT